MSEKKRTAVKKNKTSGSGKGVSADAISASPANISSNAIGNAALAPEAVPAEDLQQTLFVPSNQDVLEQRRRAGSRIQFLSPGGPLEGHLIGFLVNYDETDAGLSYQLRTGRWLVTNKKLQRSEGQLLIEHPSISETHAVIKARRDRTIELVDNGSGGTTAVLRGGIGEPIAVTDEAVELKSGDAIRLGERTFYLCLIPE